MLAGRRCGGGVAEAQQRGVAEAWQHGVEEAQQRGVAALLRGGGAGSPLGIDGALVEGVGDQVAENHEHDAVQLGLLLVEHLDHPRQRGRGVLQRLFAELVAGRLRGKPKGVADPLGQAHQPFDAQVGDVVVQRLERTLDCLASRSLGVLGHVRRRVLIQMFQHFGEPRRAGGPQRSERARLCPRLVRVLRDLPLPHGDGWTSFTHG